MNLWIWLNIKQKIYLSSLKYSNRNFQNWIYQEKYLSNTSRKFKISAIVCQNRARFMFYHIEHETYFTIIQQIYVDWRHCQKLIVEHSDIWTAASSLEMQIDGCANFLRNFKTFEMAKETNLLPAATAIHTILWFQLSKFSQKPIKCNPTQPNPNPHPQPSLGARVKRELWQCVQRFFSITLNQNEIKSES